MTILLHGFWGQPQDWNDVINRVPLGHEVLAPDLYEAGPLSPQQDFTEWTQNFLSWLDHNAGYEQVDLVGYSMGARLALTAAIANPMRFSRVLLLSGRPFIVDDAEAAGREAWEKAWGEKFASQPWKELEAAWGEQEIFSGTQPLKRRYTEPLRDSLPLSLEKWSVRNHPFEKEHVRRLKPNVEWAFGALDQKYLTVAKSLQELPVQGQINLIPNAGHRLISDAPDFIARWMMRV